jgi:basic amino acid/polyamine antiporter, APA family
VATWLAQKRDLRSGGPPFVLPGGPLIPAIATFAMIAIVGTLSRAEWSAIGIALLLLVLIYAGLRHWRLRP